MTALYLKITAPYRLPKITILLTIFFIPLFSPSMRAQNNNFIPPLPNYTLVYKDNQKEASLEYPVSDIEVASLSGDSYFAQYSYSKEKGPNVKNNFEILKLFENMIKIKRGKTTYQDHSFGVFHYENASQKKWLFLEVFNDGKEYTITMMKEDKEKIEKKIEKKEERKEKKEEQKEKKEEKIAEETNSISTDFISKGKTVLHINFYSNSSNIPQESLSLVKDIYDILKKYKTIKVSIEGHTDNIGNQQNNKILSVKRAKSVVNKLIELGINKDRLRARGWGDSKPLTSNKTEKGRTMNRRVELIKIKK